MELIEGESALVPSMDQPSSAPAAVRLAILDSDSGFTAVLGKRLRAIGWRAELLPSPPPVDQIAHMRLHAVVIDLAVLGADGWPYLEHLCSASGSQVVIVCTGPSSVAQRVRGLRLGADDWITKPCHPEEVLARIEAAVRRRSAGTETSHAPAPLITGELEIRPEMFDAYVGDRSASLSRKEYELVRQLAAADGRVLEREDIYQRVWGYTMVRGDRSVDVFVRKLRQKLEALSPEWRYVHTHFGVGYRFAAERVDGASAEQVGRSEAPAQPAEQPAGDPAYA